MGGITWAWAVSMRRRASGRKRARRESTICLAAPPAPASWVAKAEACGVGVTAAGRRHPLSGSELSTRVLEEEGSKQALRRRCHEEDDRHTGRVYS
jgi:hypothetical protein